MMKVIKNYFCCLMLFFISSFLFAQSQTDKQTKVDLQGEADLMQNPSSIIGYNLEQVFRGFKPPQIVKPIRGTEIWQDDVVFEYTAGYNLFIHKDRVWQVSLNSKYKFDFYGINIDSKISLVQNLLGKALAIEDRLLTYQLPFRNFPIKMKIAVNNDKIEEVYIYRSDL